jgi:peptidoglycan-associated lipoprotein
MKRTVLVNLLVMALILGTGAVGCKKKPQGPTPIPGRTGKASGPDTFGTESVKGANDVNEGPNSRNLPPTGAGANEVTGQGIKQTGWDPSTMDQDRTTLAADTVYFDFDSSTIKPSEKSKIEAVAAYLNANSQDGLLIEGNTDERGTEQYNLSLGERRSLAVREYLVNLGINSQRVHTISYGESRPADPAHDNAAWTKNRRDDFVVLKPKP